MTDMMGAKTEKTIVLLLCAGTVASLFLAFG
ncbi:hypothetical protein J2X43_006169 [Rhizobium sp. BE258]|jgi:hypothetical protein|nr:hypothetical protein [Rhizobium sp. BE258]